VNVQEVRRDDLIIGGLALLLVVDLLFLTWLSLGGNGFPPGRNYTATDAPDAWLGILAVISAVLIVLDVVIEQVSPQTAVPAIGGSRTATRLVLALVAGLFMGLKFLFHLGSVSNLGLGFWLGAVIVIALIYFAMRARTAALAAPHRRASPPSASSGSSGPPTS
jgi:hypothetical protein